MTRIMAVALVVVIVVAGASILWYRGELAASRADVAELTSAVAIAVDANRSANATIKELRTTSNATISVTLNWSAINDSLATEGRDAAVAITEATSDDPTTNILDTPLPDSVSAVLDRLHGQAVAAAGGRRPVSGAVDSPGASLGPARDTATAQRRTDPAQAGEVGRRGVGAPGTERGR